MPNNETYVQLLQEYKRTRRDLFARLKWAHDLISAKIKEDTRLTEAYLYQIDYFTDPPMIPCFCISHLVFVLRGNCKCGESGDWSYEAIRIYIPADALNTLDPEPLLQAYEDAVIAALAKG